MREKLVMFADDNTTLTKSSNKLKLASKLLNFISDFTNWTTANMLQTNVI